MKKMMFVLRDMLEILVENRVDLNPEVNTMSLLRWLQVLTSYNILVDGMEHGTSWFEVVSSLVTLSPLIMESKEKVYLNRLFTQVLFDDLDSSSKPAYEALMCNIFDTYSQMRRLPKIISVLLKGGLAVVTNQQSKRAEFTTKMKENLASHITRLPNAQAIDLWKGLLAQSSVLL